MNKLQIVFFFLATFGFFACTDSDSYLFEEGNSQTIEVEAFITKSFDEGAEHIHSDSVRLGDTIIFRSSIRPSKAIRSQRIYWTLDGEFFTSEFNFKGAINEPGLHKVAFVFVDIFGDTVSDTISLLAGSSPILENENFIPSNGTRSLPYNEPVRFAWNSYDPDSIWDINYRFTLQEIIDSHRGSTKFLADTIIHGPSFTYYPKLSALTKYIWTVSAENSLHQKAANTISSEFSTSGENGENAILAKIHASEGDYFPKTVHIQDLGDFSPDYKSGEFYIRNLPEGKITLILSASEYKDYPPDTSTFSLSNNQLITTDFYLLDKTAPSIKSLTAGDTLDIADTLGFLITDGNGSVLRTSVSVSIDDVLYLSDYKLIFSNDTLKIPMPFKKSWSYRILSISASDLSENKSVHNFYIRPNTELHEEF